MESEYYTNWEEYIKKDPEIFDLPEQAICEKLQRNEDVLFNFIIGLLM